MKNIKFVVKVNRGGSRAPTYVQRVDPSPIHMTTDRKLALVMGRFTAEDAIKALQNSHCIPELESVRVSAQDSRGDHRDGFEEELEQWLQSESEVTPGKTKTAVG